MTYFRTLEMFYKHNVLGAGNMYKVCVTFTEGVSAWKRNFNQFLSALLKNMSEVISTKAPKTYTNFNQGIIWYNKLIDENLRVHIKSLRILFAIGVGKYILTIFRTIGTLVNWLLYHPKTFLFSKALKQWCK